MADIEEKQKYLRDHIPAEDYEDFAEFCITYAGSLDIEGWSFVYVKEVFFSLFRLFKSFFRKRIMNQILTKNLLQFIKVQQDKL